jgi:hypothetical protein
MALEAPPVGLIPDEGSSPCASAKLFCYEFFYEEKVF